MPHIRAAAARAATSRLAARLTVRQPGRLAARLPGRLAVRAALVVTALACSLAPIGPIGAAQAKPLDERPAAALAARAAQVARWLDAARGLPPRERLEAVDRDLVEVAARVARHLDVDPVPLVSAWRRAPLQRQLVVFAALSQLGVPYRLNADEPGSALDCSALTKYAWAWGDLALARGSAAQAAAATRVAPDDVQPGDLGWYPGHVFMSLGVERVIVQARSGDRGVEVHLVDEDRADWVRWYDPTR